MTTDSVRLTVLVDDVAGADGTRPEHGAAFWLQTTDGSVLFDTGAGRALKVNAAALDVSLSETKAIVLSHGHYDHTGGLADARDAAPDAQIFCHPDSFSPKYIRDRTGTYRYIGVSAESLHEYTRDCQLLKPTLEPTQVCAGVSVTGPIPRRFSFEDTGGQFYTDDACTEIDHLWDDQALFFESPRGIVVLFGCAHAGVINTLCYVADLFGTNRFHAVIGGMHFRQAAEARLNQTIRALHEFKFECLAPLHCTGIRGCIALREAFPRQYCGGRTGRRWTFE